MSKNKKDIDHKKVGKYLGIPAQMLATMGFGVFAGMKLDKVFNFNFPILTLLFTIVFVILAIYVAIKDLIK